MKEYICIKSFQQVGISGKVNIQKDAKLSADDMYIYFRNNPVCVVTSANACEYFAINDDGKGKERGKLINQIKNLLAQKDSKHQARWDKLWSDFGANLLRRKDHEDFWIWGMPFYHASIDNLTRIYKLIKEV